MFTRILVLICFMMSHAALISANEFADQVFFIDGFSQPRRVSNLACGTNGLIEELVAKEGAQVVKGECLIRLDDELHQQLLEIAKFRAEGVGELEAAEAELKNKHQRLRIIRDLAEQGSATPDELLRTVGDYELALANRKTIKEKMVMRVAEYHKLTLESKNYCVNAPFDGVLVEYLKQKGEFVGPADNAVCVVAELAQLSVEFLVPRRFRNSLSLDSTVEVLFTESQQRVAGVVYYISPFPNGETNTYTVKINVDNSDFKLNAGERCQLEKGPTGFRTVSKTDAQNKAE